jgi:NACalpha-BTF3-like transcription factor
MQAPPATQPPHSHPTALPPDLGSSPCREKELSAVKITPDDVDVIAAEFELDRKTAERRLREHGGSLIDALRSLL